MSKMEDIIILDVDKCDAKPDDTREIVYPLLSHVTQNANEVQFTVTDPLPFDIHPDVNELDVVNIHEHESKDLLIEGFSAIIKEVKSSCCDKLKPFANNDWSRNSCSQDVSLKIESQVGMEEIPESHQCDSDVQTVGYNFRKRKQTPQSSSNSKKKKVKKSYIDETDVNNSENISRNYPDNKSMTTDNGDLITWCEKYRPRSSDKIVGNFKAVVYLSQWLSNWVKRSKSETNWEGQPKTSISSDEYYEEDEEPNDVLNCVLLSGPPGVGKTSMVYALAEEMGFKVFEVNASSRRTGKHLLNQFQEATQSHHVSGDVLPLHSYFQKITDKLNAPKKDDDMIKKTTKQKRKVKEEKGSIHFFFNNQKLKGQSEKKTRKNETGVASQDCAAKLIILDDDEPLDRNPEKNVVSQRTITSMFKKMNKDLKSTKQSDSKNDATKKLCSSLPVSETSPVNEDIKSGTESKSSEKAADLSLPLKGDDIVCECKNVIISGQCKISSMFKKKTKQDDTNLTSPITDKTPFKKSGSNQDPDKQKEARESLKVLGDDLQQSNVGISSLSLILLEDVDVIFDEDDGFWGAVNTLIEVTKKPIVLTASRNISHIKALINTYVEEIPLERPQPDDVVKHLLQLCNEETIPSPGNVKLMVECFQSDIRQCMQQLQFWGQKLCLPADINEPNTTPCTSTDNATSLTKCLQHGCLGIDQIEEIFMKYTNLKLASKLNLTCRLHGYDVIHQCFPFFIEDFFGGLGVQLDRGTEIPGHSETRKTEIVQTLRSISDFCDDLSFAEICGEQKLSPSKQMLSWMTCKPIASKLYTERVDNTVNNCFDLASYVEVFSFHNVLHHLTFLNENHTLSAHQLYDCVCEQHSFDRKSSKVEKCWNAITDVLPVIHKTSAKPSIFEYFGLFRTVCKLEEGRKMRSEKRTRRFQHYLDHLAIPLDAWVLRELAEQLEISY